MMPDTEELVIPRPAELEIPEEAPPGTGDGYRVILYNDEWHSQDEVALQVQKATGYTLEKCWGIMLEAHRKGRAVCYRGSREQCHRVAKILREIQLQCEVDCD